MGAMHGRTCPPTVVALAYLAVLPPLGPVLALFADPQTLLPLVLAQPGSVLECLFFLLRHRDHLEVGSHLRNETPVRVSRT